MFNMATLQRRNSDVAATLHVLATLYLPIPDNRKLYGKQLISTRWDVMDFIDSEMDYFD